MSDPNEENMQMNGMDHSSMGNGNGSEHQHMNTSSISHDMSMYDIFTINGKSSSAVKPLKVKKAKKCGFAL